MSETIPEDVKQEATRIADRYLGFNISCQRLYADVARALMAERERSAKIAESHADRTDYDLEPEAAVAEAVTAKQIAASIRGWLS